MPSSTRRSPSSDVCSPILVVKTRRPGEWWDTETCLFPPTSKPSSPDAVSATSILLPPSYQQPLTPFDTLIRPPHPAAEIGKSRTSPVNGGVSHSAHEPAQWPFSLSLPPSLWAGFAVPYPMPWVRDRKLAASFPRCALILRELRVSGRSLAGGLERLCQDLHREGSARSSGSTPALGFAWLSRIGTSAESSLVGFPSLAYTSLHRAERTSETLPRHPWLERQLAAGSCSSGRQESKESVRMS
jgi:hypothetical protein